MATRIRGDTRRAGHGRRMRGNHRVAQRDSKNVLRFAPNFSVYVLPPDTVCLYSEDRKFFLHGELYCALAPEIGQGGKSVSALIRKLATTCPRHKIGQAS